MGDKKSRVGNNPLSWIKSTTGYDSAKISNQNPPADNAPPKPVQKKKAASGNHSGTGAINQASILPDTKKQKPKQKPAPVTTRQAPSAFSEMVAAPNPETREIEPAIIKAGIDPEPVSPPSTSAEMAAPNPETREIESAVIKAGIDLEPVSPPATSSEMAAPNPETPEIDSEVIQTGIGLELVSPPLFLIAFSAKTSTSFKAKIKDLSNWLKDEGQDQKIGDIAFTLLAGRSHFQIRTAFIVKDVSDLKKKLSEIDSTGNFPGNENYLKSGKPDPRQAQIGEQLICELNEWRLLNRRNHQESLEKLANFYIKGYDLKWENLYRQENYRRILMPTYPFDKERYWIETPKRLPLSTESRSGVLKPHPMIAANLSTFNEQRFLLDITEGEFYFEDHGSPIILPGIAHLEAVFAAGNIAAENKPWKIEKITWDNGVPMTGNKDSGKLYLNLVPDLDTVDYQIFRVHESGTNEIIGRGQLILICKPRSCLINSS